MPIQQHVTRNAGHPWDGRHGFDLLEVRTDTLAERERFEAAAAKKFWQAWLMGVCEGGGFCGVLYKPCGQAQAWHDDPDHPHPGNLMKAL